MRSYDYVTQVRCANGIVNNYSIRLFLVSIFAVTAAAILCGFYAARHVSFPGRCQKALLATNVMCNFRNSKYSLLWE